MDLLGNRRTHVRRVKTWQFPHPPGAVTKQFKLGEYIHDILTDELRGMDWKDRMKSVQADLEEHVRKARDMDYWSRPLQTHIEGSELAASDIPEWTVELATHWKLIEQYWSEYIENKYKPGAPSLPVAPETYEAWLIRYEQQVMNFDYGVQIIVQTVQTVRAKPNLTPEQEVAYIQRLTPLISDFARLANSASTAAEWHMYIFRDFYASGRTPTAQRRRSAKQKSQKAKKRVRTKKRSQKAKLKSQS